MKQRSLAILALSVELAALGLLGVHTGYALTATALIVVHVLTSAAAAWLVHRLLPSKLRGTPELGGLFLFTIAVCLPIVGVVGLLGGLILALRWRGARTVHAPFKTTKPPDLPFRPMRMSEKPVYGEGHLVGVLRHAPRAEQRLRAVMATRQLADQYAIPILGVALKDRVDDVRLLAYALLDRKERTLYTRIQECKKELAETPPAAQLSLHKRLAQDYWELAYLGLAKGEVLTHVLTAARTHAEAALNARPDEHGLSLLLGRILLKQGKLNQARVALERALAGGLPGIAVLPQLAEVAFRERRFAQVRQHLAAIDPNALGRPPLTQVVAYWLKNEER
jgi:hypothetical protein